jgi:hypothetical protein
MPFDYAQESVRQGSPEFVEGLTTNGTNTLPFVLSLSKGACRRICQGFLKNYRSGIFNSFGHMKSFNSRSPWPVEKRVHFDKGLLSLSKG